MSGLNLLPPFCRSPVDDVDRTVSQPLGAEPLRRMGFGWLLICALGFFMVGCSTTKPVSESKQIAPATEPLAEYLNRAQAAAATAGGRELTREIYRDAAKAYPTDKRPWLRLAQSYFDASDYGNAVLSAQEVIQRDSADSTAQSVLAVSGLRISTSALASLRSQNILESSARSEAEGMARTLRALLGETVLVPRPEAATPAPSTVRRAPTRRIAPVRQPNNAVTPSPLAPAAPPNPFGVLK